MKKHLLIILFAQLGFTASLFAQQTGFTTSVDDTFNYPYYIDMMADRNVNFFDVQRAFEKYWTNRNHSKTGSYKPFKRWEYYMSTRVNPDGTRPAPEHNLNEYLNYFGSWNSLYSTASVTGNWQELGPRPLPTNGTGQPNGLGRVAAIAVHPTNGNIIFIGAPAGGLWKTTNHGTNWTSNTDMLPTLGVSSILIDHSNPSNMWIGTGDRDASDANGAGVMKSIDGGNSWTTSSTGMSGGLTVGAMVQNPVTPNVIFAATSGGVYKSYNGGANWARKSTVSNFKDIYYRPGDTTIMFATASGFFYRSANGGETWSIISSGIPSGSVRMVIGVTPANKNKVYVIATNQRTFRGCYMSSDSGLTFSLRSNSPNIMDYSDTGSDSTKGQAWYDLCMAVDTANENVIYVGGVNIFKSTDGGQNWSINAHWVGTNAPDIHADQHCMTIAKATNRLYAGNDGGIYYTSNGGSTWTDISSGLAIGQIYKIGQSKLTKNLVIAGFQDNGTAIFNTNAWSTEMGGDGMECVIDPTNDNYMWGELYYGEIDRSSNKGSSFGNFAGKGVNGITEDGAWVTPFILHRSNSNIMFIGYKNVWRTTNAKAGTPSFTKISDNLGASNSKNIKVLEQSRTNVNVLYVVREDNKLFRTDSALATTPSWTDLTSTLPVAATATDIETHPTKDSVVYMTINNKVYRSLNRGQSWTNISGTLPNVAMNCITIDVKGAEALYVGSDLGVFYRDSSMSDWVAFKQGLPATSEITELEIWYDNLNHLNSRIRAATYGRGLWESDLYSNPTSIPVIRFSASDSTICEGSTINFTEQSTNYPSKWSWSFNPATVTFVSSTNDSTQSPTVQFNAAGTYSVTLTATNVVGPNTQTFTNLITVYANPNVSASSAAAGICIGDSVQLTASGTNIVSYAWSPSTGLSNTSSAVVYAKPSANTSYTVTGTDNNGCIDTGLVQVTVHPSPSISINPNNSFILVGESVQLTANGAATYTWTPPAGLNTTTGTTVNASPVVTTTYVAVGTDANGCVGAATSFVKVAPVSVTPVFASDVFKVYPNPVQNGLLIVESKEPEMLQVEIGNMLGNMVLATQLQNAAKIDLSKLQSGLYVVTLKKNGVMVHHTIVSLQH